MEVITELRIYKITLSPDLSPDQLFSQKPVSTYFVRQMYENRNGIELSDFDDPNPSNYPPDRQEGIFTITLSAKEIGP